jgi:isopentenyl-diphosphate delta-isomerase
MNGRPSQGPEETLDRKDSHLALCLTEDVELLGAGGFAELRFEHDALPEVDLASVGTEVELLGKRLAAPILVASMTGGTPCAGEFNRRLALAAAACGLGMGLGSQRKLLERPDLAPTFDARAAAPGLPLLVGNLGAVQLNCGVGAAELRRLVAAAGCDAFFLHLNPLQEAIQPEGDTRFGGLLARIAEVAPQVGVPVLLKEVGAGISRVTARKIRELPVAGVETAGVGGTSWSRIESLRTADPVQRTTGELFARWGVPTAESIALCREELPDRIVIGSGGIRTGIEAAKALALGADAVSLALPILRAAERSVDEAVLALRRVIEELRTAMFLTGCRTVAELRRRALVRGRDHTAEG